MTDDPAMIVSNPEIMSGEPCISGTRIPAASIWSFAARDFSNDMIQRQYPYLSIEQIEAAIRFEDRRIADSIDRPPGCPTCRHFSLLYGSPRPEGTGLCRRRAPIVNPPSRRPEWPMVDRSDWCGDFAPARRRQRSPQETR